MRVAGKSSADRRDGAIRASIADKSIIFLALGIVIHSFKAKLYAVCATI